MAKAKKAGKQLDELVAAHLGHEPEGEPLNRGGVTPSDGEVTVNPRASSARLRAVVKLDRGGDS